MPFMKSNVVRFDAPFWAVLLAGVILVGSLGCLSLAAAAQDAQQSGDCAVLTTDDS